MNTTATAPDADGHTLTTLKACPVREYIRFKPNGPVWIRHTFDRHTGKYCVVKADDCNHYSLRSGKTPVYVSFSY